LSGATARRTGWPSLRRAPLHLTLLVVMVVWAIPSLSVVVTSVRPPTDIASTGWWTFFTNPQVTLDNYSAVVSQLGFARAFVNSFLIAVPSTVFPISLAALAAYGFAWLRFPGRNALFLVVVALMVVPIQAAFVPALQIFKTFGIGNSFLAIWIAHTTFALPFATFLLRSFMVQLPSELLESAQIDGATSFRTLRSIVLPLSRPAIASLAVLQFLWVWNDLLMALIFIQRDDMYPLTNATAKLLSTYGQNFNYLSSSAVLLMIVPIIVFLALQRQFVRGIVAGSVK
jgi:alpha-glucoside transport system permease protein